MSERPVRSAASGTIRHQWRFAIVLVASLLLAVVQPLASGLLGDRGSFDVFFSILIVAVMLLVFDEKEHRRIAFALGLGAFGAIWLSHGLGGLAGRMLLIGAHVLAACFFAFALCGILRTILVRQASSGALFGVVCGHLLLGIIWSVMYSAVETAFPGSFVLPAS